MSRTRRSMVRELDELRVSCAALLSFDDAELQAAIMGGDMVLIEELEDQCKSLFRHSGRLGSSAWKWLRAVHNPDDPWGVIPR